MDGEVFNLEEKKGVEKKAKRPNRFGAMI